MLPRTQQDLYDNAKSRRGFNLPSSIFQLFAKMKIKGFLLLLLLLCLLSFIALSLASSSSPSPFNTTSPSPFPSAIITPAPSLTPASEFPPLDLDDPQAEPQKGKVLESNEPLPAEKGEERREEGEEGRLEDQEAKGEQQEKERGIEKEKGKGRKATVGEWSKERGEVIGSFQHAWRGYKTYAWGHDELHPISRRGSDWFHLGLTLVDSLDLMILMGLQQEFSEAREWVRSEMTYHHGESNLFEVTIRVLGGLLSAYALSDHDPLFLEKAQELGDRLMAAFSSSSPVPYASVDLKDKRGIPASHNGGDSSTAEVSTIQLEFTALSHLTHDLRFVKAADDVITHMRSLPKDMGLVPIFINPHTGQFSGHTIRLGSRGDSYYEYLLKQWIHTNQTEAWHREMYDETVAGIKAKLLKRSEPSKLLFVAELENGWINNKMDHLVCFLPGVLALGATRGKTEEEAQAFMSQIDREDLQIAKELTYTCYQMYAQMPTGLAPEIVYFNTDPHVAKDLIVKPLDTHNLLRPETVESLFILFRITRDEKYRIWGKEIFDAFERHAKVPEGYSSLSSVLDPNAPKRDKMESFFLGETLKYLFLLFCDDTVLPLEEYVFNTEAHPLPIIPKHPS